MVYSSGLLLPSFDNHRITRLEPWSGRYFVPSMMRAEARIFPVPGYDPLQGLFIFGGLIFGIFDQLAAFHGLVQTFSHFLALGGAQEFKLIGEFFW